MSPPRQRFPALLIFRSATRGCHAFWRGVAIAHTAGTRWWRMKAAHPAADAAFCAAKHRMASAHSIAECFAPLTGRLRFAPADAARLIRDGLPDMHRHVLPAADVLAVTAGASALGVRGGLIYNALIVATARHAKAGLILTGNRAHFLPCAPDLADIIREP